MPSTLSHIEALSTLAATGKPFVAITLVEATGSTPQDAGSKMLVDDHGLVHGTVGGGKIENRAINHASEMLRDKTRFREIIDWNLNRDIGMTCGGLVKLFFEVYNRDDWKIVIFGAGHVAQAVVTCLLNLDCSISCIDTRQEWLDRLPTDPSLTKICSDDLTVQVNQLQPADFVLCMTMGHSSDRPVLRTIFQNQLTVSFLGVIGSKSKRAALIRELKAEGIAANKAEDFICPVGLPVGSNQPAEIAISIAAQLLQHRDAKVAESSK